ncbi:alpha/beta hydrolase [Thiohalophilus sp.]|uniref:esterase/lipase family protein n=1 Tax=Thiohalophilus sp. TaxID=3028392 RepID=UPI002ACE58E3|nr:alpha/beta hydrolase [Thiohalophilus sp.]MDZ7804966.1 alpha/beta hydrolase [Thiohalophilus sp.]
MYRTALVLLAAILLTTGCMTPNPSDPALWDIDPGNLPTPNISVNINGLGPCTDNPDRTLHLDSQSPTVILAHGCFSSSGRFRSLSEVFAFHGQQTACFTYDDRDSLNDSSAEMIHSLQQLSKTMDNKQFTIIGHSQGGLITRKALVRERDNQINTDAQLRLITISSPFSGISAASHCGSPVARILSLGLVVPICYAISGGKWFEITSVSDFIRQPGTLIPQVNNFIKIVTDERNTCRQYNQDGRCIEDDYVFSLKEQYYPLVDNDDRVTNVEIKAGHVEIVGDQRIAPTKLIHIFQSHGIMNKTAQTENDKLKLLLSELYDLP